MKSYKRLFLPPRVRSNSITTLAVVPSPSSTSRPVRIPSEGPKQLALAQPTPGLVPPLFPCNPPLSPNPVPSPISAAFSASTSEHPRASKRQRLKYQLDVGAYGIPKHRRTHTRSSYPHTSLSVQVGEDAYFVRENAMGIADGVGGWAKSVPSTTHPTPSALFARRLMHFCSAEIDALSRPSTSSQSSSTVRPPTAQFSFEYHLKPRTSFTTPDAQSALPYDQSTYNELEDSLSSSLEELSEGIDVLQILERAYDATVKSHMEPASPATPLHTGSSTALLAVLDHPPPIGEPLLQNPEAPHRNYAAGSINTTPASTVPSTTPISHTPLRTSAVHSTTVDPVIRAAEILANSPRPADPAVPLTFKGELDPVDSPYDAVLRIAHLGDCMGMLVRGEEIVWRSDEMWWGYNHPLQLGPPSANSPVASSSTTTLPVLPHTFSLPVCADDILILSSDGLSDNLWDEDVLDEVIKFRRAGGFDVPSVAVPPTTDNILEAISSLSLNGTNPSPSQSSQAHLLRRRAFAGMLSEALCSRAKRISEGKAQPSSKRRAARPRTPSSSNELRFSVITEESEGESPGAGIGLVTSERVDKSSKTAGCEPEEDEVPFGRRAKLAGKTFRGGKHDDISVIVAVISPCHSGQSNNLAESKRPDPHS